MHPALVLLILPAVIGSKADGIAKIVCRQSRHHRIQINHTQSLHRRAVQQHIVELGVVVGHPQRQLSVCQHPDHHRAILFSAAHKLDFPLYALRTSQQVLLHCLLKVTQAFGCVVEVRNGFAQLLCVKVLQLTLELSKRCGTLVQILLVSCLLQADAASM